MLIIFLDYLKNLRYNFNERSDNMQVLFATTNQAKILKYKQRLEDKGIELLTINDLDYKLDIEENGKNALENAYIKASSYYDEFGIPTIGMDDNLFIEGIKESEQPGVFVRRVNGKELNDDEMIEHYTNLVKKYGNKLIAKWVYGMVVINNGESHEFSWSYDDFYLVDTPSEKRNIGYPLDSISIDINTNKYFVDLTNEDKQKKKESIDEVISFILKSIGK